MVRCNGYLINLRCVCVYDMYWYGIFDICNKIVLCKNGSLYYVNGKNILICLI